MGLTFLQQLVTVGCLAFTSGLMLGFAFYRGEIGNLGRPRFPSIPQPRQGSAPPRSRRKRPPLSLADLHKAAVETLRDMDPALMWVLIALAMLLTASAVITRLTD